MACRLRNKLTQEINPNRRAGLREQCTATKSGMSEIARAHWAINFSKSTNRQCKSLQDNKIQNGSLIKAPNQDKDKHTTTHIGKDALSASSITQSVGDRVCHPICMYLSFALTEAIPRELITTILDCAYVNGYVYPFQAVGFALQPTRRDCSEGRVQVLHVKQLILIQG